MKINYTKVYNTIVDAKKITVIQAENPDGDSMASSAAIEALFPDIKVEMFCLVDIPPHLHYIDGWDRVTNKLSVDSDLYIIVDTSSNDLLEKTLELPESSVLRKKDVIVFDHHPTESSLSFKTIPAINEKASSTSQVIYELVKDNNHEISVDAGEKIIQSLLADSRGLTNNAVTIPGLEMLVDLVRQGVSLPELEQKRVALQKKSQRITAYKAKLLERIEYFLDGRLAIVIVPWREIEEYSYEYNPAVLVIGEMQQVTDVEVAIVFKTYPDKKITAKIRSNINSPICKDLAEHFGAGGHPNASGLKVYKDDFSKFKDEVISKVEELLK